MQQYDESEYSEAVQGLAKAAGGQPMHPLFPQLVYVRCWIAGGEVVPCRAC